MDFVILDLDDKVKVPLILEQPFLVTSQALIDGKDSQMVLRVAMEKLCSSCEIDKCYK